MGWWFIVGVILICITLFILKHTQVTLSYAPNTEYEQWDNIELQLWVFILIVIIGLLPIVNIIIFSVLLFCMIIDDDYRFTFILKLTNNKTIVYIKKILTKRLF